MKRPLDKILPDLDKIAGVKILEQNLVRSYKNSKHLVRSDKILIRFFSWVFIHKILDNVYKVLVTVS